MRGIGRWLAGMVIVGGCGDGPIEGTWQGACDLTNGPTPEHYAIEAFSLLGRREITGEAVVQPDWLDAPIEGQIAGTFDGEEVSLVASLGDQTMGFVLTLEGTLSPDAIRGDCRTDFGATGPGELARVGDVAGG